MNIDNLQIIQRYADDQKMADLLYFLNLGNYDAIAEATALIEAQCELIYELRHDNQPVVAQSKTRKSEREIPRAMWREYRTDKASRGY